ncbi:alpha/beta fold hydrolase [Vagococcus acidifermentans]|nr:alpha/beta hydrolase [Vagococcus acidifermentans]
MKKIKIGGIPEAQDDSVNPVLTEDNRMTVVFVHGLGQQAASWDKTKEALSGSADIFTPDLWELSAGSEVTYDHLYDVFSDYCQSLSGKVHLCGLSLGGVLALHYGLEHPEKAASLTLIATQYQMPKTLLKCQNIFFRLLPGKLFEQMGLTKKEVIGLTRSMMDLNFKQRLSEINVPVAVVCGEKDTANKKAAAELARLIPHAELSMVPRAGHEVNEAAPQQLAALLDGFILRRAQVSLNRSAAR